jgi:hypothetical protein
MANDGPQVVASSAEERGEGHCHERIQRERIRRRREAQDQHTQERTLSVW